MLHKLRGYDGQMRIAPAVVPELRQGIEIGRRRRSSDTRCHACFPNKVFVSSFVSFVPSWFLYPRASVLAILSAERSVRATNVSVPFVQPPVGNVGAPMT